ncbi:MAG: hypothetical protein ACR2GY_05300 [Phycisphaerales bacterium]
MKKTRPSAFAQVCSALLLLVLWSQPALAQGTEGFLPDPITSEQFQHEIEHLDLTWEQRLAVEAAHEQYKVEARQYREGEIEKFIKKLSEMQGGGSMMPQRKDIEEMLKLREDGVARIRSIDRSLFTAMNEVMTDVQRPRLDRMRRVRERTIYESSIIESSIMQNMFDDSSMVNLLELVRESKFSPAVEEAVEPPLIDYEIAVNIALRDAEEEMFKAIMKMFDMMSNMGITGGEEIEPEDMAEIGMAMQQAMAEVMQGAQQAAAKVKDVTDRSQRAIAAALPEQERASFEMLYRRRMYPGVYEDWSSPERLMDAIIASDRVPAAARNEVRIARDAWQPSYESFCRQMVELDEKQKKSNNAFTMNPDFDWEAYSSKRQEIQTKRTELNERTREKVIAAIEPDEAERERFAMLEYDASAEDIAAAIRGEDIVQDEFFEAEDSVEWYGRSDLFIPAAMAEPELALYLKRLGLGEDRITIAMSLYPEYVETSQALQQAALEVINTARGSFRTEEKPFDEGTVRDIEKAAAEILTAQSSADDAFLQDIAALCAAEHLDRLPAIRKARELERLDVGRQGMGWVTTFQLMPAVAALDLDQPAVTALAPVLAEYEVEALPLFRKQQEAAIALQIAEVRAQVMQHKFFENEANHDDQQAMWAEYQKLTGEATKRVQQLARERNTLIEKWVPEIANALPAEASEKFLQLFNESRYPEVYPDRTDARPMVNAAYSLRDLSPEQQNALDRINQEHIREHEAYSDELVRLTAAEDGNPWWDSDDETGPDAKAMEEWQRRMIRTAQVQFYRIELNETTRRALRATLSQEQATRVPGLASFDIGDADADDDGW